VLRNHRRGVCLSREKENPQGVIAVVQQQRVQLADLSPQNFPWGVAIVSPQDPGNVGTILRTIDAVGASGLILLDSSVDPYHPTAVRARVVVIDIAMRRTIIPNLPGGGHHVEPAY